MYTHDGKIEDVFGSLTAAFHIVSQIHAGTEGGADAMNERELRREIKAMTTGIDIQVAKAWRQEKESAPEAQA